MRRLCASTKAVGRSGASSPRRSSFDRQSVASRAPRLNNNGVRSSPSASRITSASSVVTSLKFGLERRDRYDEDE
jgi:hypothetical protein